MPCYLFTFHAYGTWMPDRPQGYVHHTSGLQPRDPAMAERYRAKQAAQMVNFTHQMQQCLVDAAIQAQTHVQTTVHAVATDPTHVHVLVSWNHARTWESIRRSLRHSFSRALNGQFTKRAWFAAQGSRKRIRDHAHFDHLTNVYLPDHRGVVSINSRSEP
ncbi:MAG: hypothetical protein KAS72_08705 [Phycisphaerales bacterium]|nr:hypothetical protein [Phycisphaerales bacterium]